MINCIKTDSLRVLTKRGVVINTLFYLLTILLGGVATHYFQDFEGQLISFGFEAGDLAFSSVIGMLLAIFIMLPGIVLYKAVFADDLLARSAQAAIGAGLSRARLILSRFLEMILLAFLICLVAFLLVVGMGIILGVQPSTFWELGGSIVLDILLPFACFVSVSMIVVYPFQSSTFGLVVYLLLEFGVDSSLAYVLNMVPFFRDMGIDFSRYTVTGLLGIYKAAPEENLFYLLILIAAYLLLPLVLTVVLFKNRELEF